MRTPRVTAPGAPNRSPVPIFLQVDGRECLVVGGGPVAARKAAEYLRGGARVRVVSPTLSTEWDALLLEAERAAAARAEGPDSRLHWFARPYRRGDGRGAFVAVAATGNSSVDAFVSEDARASGAIVQVVDRVDESDFFSGAVIRRGPVAIAIGTGGASPTLARALRARIETVLPDGLDALAEALGDAREELLRRHPDFGARSRLLEGFVRDALSRLDAGASREEILAGVAALVPEAGHEEAA